MASTLYPSLLINTKLISSHQTQMASPTSISPEEGAFDQDQEGTEVTRARSLWMKSIVPRRWSRNRTSSTTTASTPPSVSSNSKRWSQTFGGGSLGQNGSFAPRMSTSPSRIHERQRSDPLDSRRSDSASSSSSSTTPAPNAAVESTSDSRRSFQVLRSRSITSHAGHAALVPPPASSSTPTSSIRPSHISLASTAFSYPVSSSTRIKVFGSPHTQMQTAPDSACDLGAGMCTATSLGSLRSWEAVDFPSSSCCSDGEHEHLDDEGEEVDFELEEEALVDARTTAEVSVFLSALNGQPLSPSAAASISLSSPTRTCSPLSPLVLDSQPLRPNLSPLVYANSGSTSSFASSSATGETQTPATATSERSAYFDGIFGPPTPQVELRYAPLMSPQEREREDEGEGGFFECWKEERHDAGDRTVRQLQVEGAGTGAEGDNRGGGIVPSTSMVGVLCETSGDVSVSAEVEVVEGMLEPEEGEEADDSPSPSRLLPAPNGQLQLGLLAPPTTTTTSGNSRTTASSATSSCTILPLPAPQDERPPVVVISPSPSAHDVALPSIAPAPALEPEFAPTGTSPRGAPSPSPSSSTSSKSRRWSLQPLTGLYRDRQRVKSVPPPPLPHASSPAAGAEREKEKEKDVWLTAEIGMGTGTMSARTGRRRSMDPGLLSRRKEGGEEGGQGNTKGVWWNALV